VLAASDVIGRLPFVPSALEWLHVGRTSVVIGHREGQVTAGLDSEIHCRRDAVGVGRGNLAVAGVPGGTARRCAAFVGPVGAIVGSLCGVAQDVVVRSGCARIRLGGLGLVPVHWS